MTVPSLKHACIFSVLLLQKNGDMEVRLSTERGEYRMCALFLLIMFIIASLGCIFWYVKQDSCQSHLDELLQLKGRYDTIVENRISGSTSELVTTKDQLLEVHKIRATDEGARNKECEKKVIKLEGERDRLSSELSRVKEEKAKKEIDYLKISKSLEDCEKKS